MREIADAEAMPLTQAEHGIWLGQQLNPASPLYNAAEAIEICGPLSPSNFGSALCQALVEAPAFHRVFQQAGDGVQQRFTAVKPNVAVLDFSAEANPAEKAEVWMRKDLTTTVDLARGPLYQQALIKLADEHYLWYQRIHHIAADGFAFALFSQRVAEIYNAQLENRDSGKPLADYAAVVRDDQTYQNSARRNASRDFWLSRLPQSPRPVSLSRSRAPIEQWPLHLSTEINSDSFSRLKRFAQEVDCNWADVITGAVAALIYQRTAADDIILGLPVMGRIGTPALRVPAMVMNIAPLRLHTKNLRNLQDWAKQVAAEQNICRPHQRYRYEHLRRDLNAVGGDKRLYGPVVNIMPFDRQLRFGKASAQVRNLSAGPVEDISFAFVLQPDNSLRFDLEANPARYNEPQLADYQQQLLAMFADLAQPLPISPQYLSWLNGGELQNPLPSVVELFAAQVHARPNAIALVNGNTQLSYSALYEKSLSFAAGLKKHQLQSGDTVALALPRGEAAVISCLGCLLAGTPYVFLDPKGPGARNQRILQDAAPKLMVSLEASDATIAFNALLNSAFTEEIKKREIAEDALAYLVYTSGSTGAPKGVMVGRRALAEFVVGAAQIYGIENNDRVLQYAPLHFDASVEEIFVTLCLGATLVIRSESMLDSVASFLDTCARWQISVLDLPTAYWHELVYFCHSTGTPLPPALHTIIIGGEAALPERVRQWHELPTHNIRLLNTYGPSETTVVASCAQLVAHQLVSIGTPLPGRQMAVVDRQGRILPRGEAGELLVLGGGIATGYRNMPEATAARFCQVQFPWQENSQPAYFTGDRALITQQGTVEYLGRLDAEIKISGYRINPVEIESVILSLGLARDVAVVVPNGSGDQKSLAAFMVAANDIAAVEIQTLRHQLADFLPAPMLPTRVEYLPQLPQSSAGKVDRKALAALAAAGATDTVNSDLSAEEQLVIRTWQQVLGTPQIHPDDDFFLLGGQSLQTIQVANRLSAALQRDIPVTLLFEHPTVQQLAAALNEQAAQKIPHVKDWVDADLSRFQVELSPAKNRPNTAWVDYRTILLTGASGFVGAQLLYQLFQSSDAQILCLIRAENREQAFAKISKALAKQKLVVNELEKRVDVVLADLEQPDLGLAKETCLKLAAQCDVIFHNAANTSVMRDYKSLRAANVFSTQTLLQLAAINGVPFHLISTIAVAPADGLPEEFVPWHEGLQDGYQQSKWASERSAQMALQLGYPISVYRLARVVGDLQSGAVNDKDLVWNIAAASVRNKVFPLLPIQEPWTPVDLVVRTIIANAQQLQPQAVLNIMPPSAVALGDVGHWLRDADFALESVSVQDWCARLSRSTHEQDRAILGFFQQRKNAASAEMTLPIIDDKNAHRLILANGIEFPEITQRHFNTYLREAINQRLITAPFHTTDSRGLYEPA